MRHHYTLLVLTALLCLTGCAASGVKADDTDAFVRVSETNPSYFCLSNGNPYIPIGCNLAAMDTPEHMEHYMEMLHLNGGNFARIWLNSNFFEIQKEYGRWDGTSISHIDRLLELASLYGIKIKMCIESFRMIKPGRNKWNIKASYHTSNGGPFEDMQEYISSEKGKEEFLRRLEFLHERYGSHPAVFGWELWNEMNAVEAEGVAEWTEAMLPIVHEMFPNNLVMQSLGSLDKETSFHIYEEVNKMASNDVMQVHRYIDEGEPLAICGEAADILASDAINHMRSYGRKAPILLAEGGAVLPVHTGPHTIYLKDSLGTVLHDFLFTPFFCGAAGPGHLWHWDHYIDKMDVWFQIGRFSKAVEGINPLQEDFVPTRNDAGQLRVYTLAGDNHIIAWCRDTVSTWKNELRDGIPAEIISGAMVDFSEQIRDRSITSVQLYDPWGDSWIETKKDACVQLPDFKRSIVVKITL